MKAPKKQPAETIVDPAPATPAVDDGQPREVGIKPVTVDDGFASAAITQIEPERICSGCRYWRKSGPFFGQCMLSGRYAAVPVTTTDQSSCGGWSE